MDSHTRTFLESLKARNSAANVPSISPETGALLSGLVKEFGTASLLELGTAHGYSTVTLASAMWEAYESRIEDVRGDAAEPSIVTVDFSKPSYEAALANVEEAGYSPMVEHVFADALQYVPTIADKRFDAVFLDAEKRSTAKLFALAWPLLKSGGWMVVDDVVKFRAKMDDFYSMLETSGLEYEIVMTDPDDGVMVFRKPA